MQHTKFIPSYAVYVNEMASKPIMIGFSSLEAAKVAADAMLRSKYVIRRSKLTPVGERPNGMVVHTVR